MSASFSEQIFDEKCNPWGIVAGFSFSTTIISTGGGFEQRNANWDRPLAMLTIGGDRTLTQSELTAFVRFMHARQGRLQGFRIRNPLDFYDEGAGVIAGKNSSGVLMPGIADGTAKSYMVKLYASGDEVASKRIFKPRSSTISLFVNAVKKLEGTDYTLDYTTGIITWLTTPPQPSDAVQWTGLFDTPVRFDSDQPSFSIIANEQSGAMIGGSPEMTKVHVQLETINIVEVMLIDS